MSEAKPQHSATVPTSVPTITSSGTVENVMREAFTGNWLETYPSGRAQLAMAQALDQLTAKIDQLIERTSMASDQLTAAFAALQAEVDSAVAADAAAVTELQDLAAQVQGLQPGAALSSDQITTLTNSLTTATAALTAATGTAGTAGAQGTPATPAAPTDTTAGTGTGTTDTTGTDPTAAPVDPSAAPADPTATTPTGDVAPDPSAPTS